MGLPCGSALSCSAPGCRFETCSTTLARADVAATLPFSPPSLQLFTDVAPKTCENFRALCQGTHKSAERGDALLTYAGSVFHRVQKLGWLQGGDIVGGAGDKGESIYGPTFEDESFAMKHSKRGILSMANTGIHTNNSQFFITFRALDWLDTKYVAFGYATLESLACGYSCWRLHRHPCAVASTDVLCPPAHTVK